MPIGWAATRARILKRDGYRCSCGAEATEVNHDVPGSEADEDLSSKCEPCHRAITQAQATAARLARPSDR